LNNYNSNLSFGAQNVILGAAAGSPSSIAGNVITGTSSLTYAGPGTLTLNGANAYTGGTTISKGTLAIGSDAALNNGGTGTTTFIGGSLQFNNYASTGLMPTSGTTLFGAQAISLGAATGAASSVTTAATGGLTTGALTFVGPGTLALGGTNAFASTTLSGGELSISSGSNIGANALIFNGGTLQITSSTIPATGTGSLNITGSGFNGGFDITGANIYTTNVALTGSGSLAKLGTGTLILGGANTYSGGNFIVGGTIQAGVANAIGTGAVTMAPGTTLDVHGFGTTIGAPSGLGVIDDLSSTPATLTINTTASTTYAGNIQSTNGSLSLVKVGTSGTLTLSGNNSYTGATTISSGSTLLLGSATALGKTSGVTIVGGGTLNLGGFSQSITSGTGAAIQSSGSITTSNAATLTLNLSGSTVDSFGGVISGPITVNLNPNGTTGGLTLTAANTFTGGASIGGGTLALGNSAALGTGQNITIAAGGIIDMASNSPTINGLSGAGTILNSTSGKTSTLTIGSGNANGTNFSGVIENNAGTGGTVSVTKTGTGTITLSGANTYSGTTTFAQGVLAITNDASLGTSALSFTGGVLQFANYNSNFIFPSNPTTGTPLNLTLGAATGTPSTLSGPVTGTSSIVFVGPGILALEGNNNYLGLATTTVGGVNYGGTTIEGGELSISSLNNIGQSPNNLTPAVNLLSGGILQVTGNALTNLNQAVVNTGVGTWPNFNGGFDIVSPTNTFLISQTVIGTGFIKQGAGTVELTSSLNSITGTTNIGNGILQLGDGGIDGSLGSGSIVDNGSLVVDSAGNVLTGPGKNALSFSQTISGTGSFVQAGSGTTTLSGNNSYKGGTFVNNGLLAITSDNAVGGSAATVTFGGGTLELNNSASTFAGSSSALTYGSQNIKLGVLGSVSTGQFLSNGSAGSLTFVGPGTLTVNGVNTYTGGTNINGGTVLVSATSTSGALGTGPINVNSGGALGTPVNSGGTIAGNVTVNSGGDLFPGDPAILTLRGNLTLNSGAALTYSLGKSNSVPTTSGNADGNDLVTVNNGTSALTLNPNLTVNVTPVSGTVSGTPFNFGVGAYQLITYNQTTLVDNSNHFTGWTPQFTSWNLGTSDYVTFQEGQVVPSSTGGVADGGSNRGLGLAVTAGTPQITTTSGPAFIIQANGVKIDNFAGTGTVQAPVTGGNSPTNFYVVNQPYSSASPNPPTKSNGFTEITSTVGVAAPVPLEDAVGDIWISGFQYLSATVQYVDPPTITQPHYIGESYTPIVGASNIYLAAEPIGGTEFVGATLLNTTPPPNPGADASNGVYPYNPYQGSFLSYLKSVFGNSITDPGNLTSSQWNLVEGEYGVDPTNDVAWAVTNDPSANYAVFGLVGVGIETTPLPTSLLGGLVLMGGLGFITARKRRRTV
jgi:autotransporter-associated beta strand protein